MDDGQMAGKTWDPVTDPPRVGDVFRSKLGDGEVELKCFDPTYGKTRGVWRVGYGEHDVISQAALAELYCPVARGPEATSDSGLRAFAKWWAFSKRIVWATEAVEASIAGAAIDIWARWANGSHPMHTCVLYALEAIAAYERARGIDADYSRSDHSPAPGAGSTRYVVKARAGRSGDLVAIADAKAEPRTRDKTIDIARLISDAKHDMAWKMPNRKTDSATDVLENAAPMIADLINAAMAEAEPASVCGAPDATHRWAKPASPVITPVDLNAADWAPGPTADAKAEIPPVAALRDLNDKCAVVFTYSNDARAAEVECVHALADALAEKTGAIVTVLRAGALAAVEVKDKRGTDDETVALHVAATDAPPEWAKPGRKVRRFSTSEAPSRVLDVIAVDGARVLLYDPCAGVAGTLLTVHAPGFDDFWPICVSLGEGEVVNLGGDAPPEEVDIALRKLRSGPQRSETSAEVFAKAESAANAEAPPRMVNGYDPASRKAFLEADIAALDRMIAERPNMGAINRMSLEGRRAQAREELDAIGRKALLREDIACLEKMIAGRDVRLDGRQTQVQEELDALRAKLAAGDGKDQ